MKVVLDTNVLVSGLMTPGGACGRIVDLLLGGTLEVYVDDRIVWEYSVVLQRPELRIEPDDAAEVLALIRTRGRQIPTVPLATALPDQDDLPFLEVASAAGALLVTGNARHYPKRVRVGVVVLSPADLLELLRAAS